MNRPLELDDLNPCLEGIIPAGMVTVDADGTPNVIKVSKVTRVDARHVALSRQFFRKTLANLRRAGRVCFMLTHPSTYEGYRIHARGVGELRDGPVFESMRAQIDVVASLTGMTDVFKLECADVFEVNAIDAVAGCLVT
jgi:predicted pyridoxine 5'-phosphate oxidase superfamily flavin-nucleotide-binding protein